MISRYGTEAIGTDFNFQRTTSVGRLIHKPMSTKMQVTEDNYLRVLEQYCEANQRSISPFVGITTCVNATILEGIHGWERQTNFPWTVISALDGKPYTFPLFWCGAFGCTSFIFLLWRLLPIAQVKQHGVSLFLNSDNADSKKDMVNAQTVELTLKAQLSKAVREMKQKHMAPPHTSIEKCVSKKVREKDVEIENMNRKNRVLEARIKHVATEEQNWHYKAKHNRSVVNVLRNNL